VANTLTTSESSEIFDRARLLIDLDEATDPTSPASALLVLGLPLPGENRATFSTAEIEELVEQLRDKLAGLVGNNGSVYRTRSTELCAFIDGKLLPSDDMLDLIRTELDLECEPLAVRVSLGCVALPGEATEPTAALALADARARVTKGRVVLHMPSFGTPRAGSA
jgi:hypothetical protein